MTVMLKSGAEQAAGSNAPAMLELRGISKQFVGVKALDGVTFQVNPGEVHMLLGENGAGKSTLMKILCGAYIADTGEFYSDGQLVTVRSTTDARRLGVSVIFQEFSLVPFLDVAQNIFLGREFAGVLPGLLDRGRLYREARQLLEKIGFDMDPHQKVHELGIAQQQMVEIAKALSQETRILVMDEPTAALSDRETEALFAIIARLKAQGVAIIYISHRLAEVFALGDRITVLRDGKMVGSTTPSQVTPAELVSMMVGRSVSTTYPRNFVAQPGAIVLEVDNISTHAGVRDVSLTVRAGEIVGLCGLVGSGRSEVARAIFGADPLMAGEVRVNGEKRYGGPDVAAGQGLALIPESRKTDGLALIRSVGDNLNVAALERHFPNRIFSPARARSLAADLIARLRIATAGPRQTVGVLSGGNQQKVVIGKWLGAGSRLYIFDEPTRGIDVGAKSEIFALIDQLVSEGTAVLMISSEQNEIVQVCDRAYVMRQGTVVGHLQRHELTEENIVRMGMHDE